MGFVQEVGVKETEAAEGERGRAERLGSCSDGAVDRFGRAQSTEVEIVWGSPRAFDASGADGGRHAPLDHDGAAVDNRAGRYDRGRKRACGSGDPVANERSRTTSEATSMSCSPFGPTGMEPRAPALPLGPEKSEPPRQQSRLGETGARALPDYGGSNSAKEPTLGLTGARG